MSEAGSSRTTRRHGCVFCFCVLEGRLTRVAPRVSRSETLAPWGAGVFVFMGAGIKVPGAFVLARHIAEKGLESNCC